LGLTLHEFPNFFLILVGMLGFKALWRHRNNHYSLAKALNKSQNTLCIQDQKFLNSLKQQSIEKITTTKDYERARDSKGPRSTRTRKATTPPRSSGTDSSDDSSDDGFNLGGIMGQPFMTALVMDREMNVRTPTPMEQLTWNTFE